VITEAIMLLAEDLSERVIGLAITVHRHTGAACSSRLYEQCLCYELTQAGLPFERRSRSSHLSRRANR